VTPTLTTIAYPIQEIGIKAVDCLLAQIHAQPYASIELLDYTIIAGIRYNAPRHPRKNAGATTREETAINFPARVFASAASDCSASPPSRQRFHQK